MFGKIHPENVPPPEETDIDHHELILKLHSLVERYPKIFSDNSDLVHDIEYVFANSPEDFLKAFEETGGETVLLNGLCGYISDISQRLREVLEKGIIPDKEIEREVENRLTRLEMYAGVYKPGQ